MMAGVFDAVVIDIFVAAIRANCLGRDMPLRFGPPSPSSMAMTERLLTAFVERCQTVPGISNYPLINTINQGVERAVSLFSGPAGDGDDSGSADGAEQLRTSYTNGTVSVLVGILGPDLIFTVLGSRADLEDLEEEKGDIEAAVLMAAAYLDRLDDMAQILDKGIDINCDPQDKWVYPPLMAAALAGNMEVVKFLLERGVELDTRTVGNGYSALHFAALTGQADLIHFLMDRGLDPDIRNNDGDTPLHFAAAGGHTQAVQGLLSSDRVNVNRQDHWDCAP
ncbi:ankyrin repeat-containing domain protein [Aspergillus aurantiobrunneus]